MKPIHNVTIFLQIAHKTHCTDHYVYASSQWEMALHCNAVSHWLSAYTEWSLYCVGSPVKVRYGVSCEFMIWSIRGTCHCEVICDFACFNSPPFRRWLFRLIFMNEKFCISIRISLKSVPKSLIDNKSALVHVMACYQTGYKPLPEPMRTQFTHAYLWHWGEMS